MTTLDEFTAPQHEVLARYRFDSESFDRLRRELAAGAFGPERNKITSTVRAPSPEAIRAWPTASNAAECAEIGKRALDAGQVGALILNGGMATRFGGVVKGVVEVLPGQSFIALKIGQIRQCSPHAPVFLMNSFATDAPTQSHLRALEHSSIHPITQGISVRLTPDGDIFRTPDGKPSFYAPGHGDVFSALAASSAFHQFVEAGGKCIMVSNVDNLGATIDPIVVGTHLTHASPATVEVAPKHPGDKGGAPAVVENKLQIVEGFRFPNGFDQDAIHVFNTNTLLFDVSVFREEPPLDWFRADKIVEDQSAVQFERLMGQATQFIDAEYLEVPREGPQDRFMPVKTPSDLERLRGAIAARLRDVVALPTVGR